MKPIEAQSTKLWRNITAQKHSDNKTCLHLQCLCKCGAYRDVTSILGNNYSLHGGNEPVMVFGIGTNGDELSGS